MFFELLMARWRNGSRGGLKIPWTALSLPVRVRSELLYLALVVESVDTDVSKASAEAYRFESCSEHIFEEWCNGSTGDFLKSDSLRRI